MSIKHFLCMALAIILTVSEVCYAQSNSFDTRYKSAETQFSRKQYQAAINTLQKAKQGMGVSTDQIDRANGLIARCQEEIRKMNIFKLDQYVLNIPFSGSVDTIHVEAGKAWTASVLSGDSWVSIQSQGNDYLIIRTLPYDGKEDRTGQVKVSMDKQMHVVTIAQVPRPDTRRMVRVETDPSFATVWMDGNDSRSVTPWSVEVGAGRHVLRIEKDGYASIDTVFVVEDNLSTELIPLRFHLKKHFGLLRFQVDPEEGFRFSSDVSIELNRAPVRMTGRRNKFDSTEPIAYYTQYEDGSIPVYPGRYSVLVRTDNFKSFEGDYDIFEDMDTLIRVNLEALAGKLTIHGTESAEGATVLMDGKAIGKVPMTNYRVGIGEHILSFDKEGYLPAEKTIPIFIQENVETEVDAVMFRYGRYRFTTTPDRASLYVDDILIGETPREYALMEGEHHIRIVKPGFKTYEQNLTTVCGEEIIPLTISMQNTYPLAISCDVDSLQIVIRQGNEIFTQAEKTPATVHIPFSDKNYRLELYSAKRKRPVYWGPLRFNSEEKTRHKVLSYSNSIFQILAVDIHAFNNVSNKVSFYDPQLKLLKFPLFPGLSLSIFKGAAFGLEDNPSVQSMFHDGGYLLGVSMLTNPEFRIGGRIFENLDISAIGTYSWYPDWSKVISDLSKKATFMTSGMDYFIGGELSSRLPVIQLHVRAGCQWYRMEGLTGPRSDTPFFVVSLGFALSDKTSKGENILRIF